MATTVVEVPQRFTPLPADGARELHPVGRFTNLAARRLYGRLGFVETGFDTTHLATARRFDR